MPGGPCENQVHGTGQVSERRKSRSSSLEDADFLVLASHDEGMPMSVLEALSYGLAVICAPVSALPEVTEPKVSGLVVPVCDHDAVAGALVRIISAAGLRQKLGRNARRRSQDELEISGYADRLLQIYRDALGVIPTGLAAERSSARPF